MVKSSDIIDIDLLDFLFLAEVKVDTLIFIFTFGVWIRVRAFSFIVAFYEFNSTCRSILILIDIEILRNLSLSFELSNLVGKVFKNDVTFFILELAQAAHK